MPDGADYTGALEAVDRILNRGGEPEDVLGAVAAAVRERTGFEIVFVGPGELDVQPEPDAEARTFLDRVALLASAHAPSIE